jgi:hypothetical protein
MHVQITYIGPQDALTRINEATPKPPRNPGGRAFIDTGYVPFGLVQMAEGEPYHPLAIRDVERGRFLVALIDGEIVELDNEVAFPAVYEAVEEIAEKILGHSWNSGLGELFDLNRRTMQRDRVSRFLLPPNILAALSYIASADYPEELAKLLLAINAYHTRFKDQKIVEERVKNALKVFYDQRMERAFRH